LTSLFVFDYLRYFRIKGSNCRHGISDTEMLDARASKLCLLFDW
jgi:hypothetical protein